MNYLLLFLVLVIISIMVYNMFIKDKNLIYIKCEYDNIHYLVKNDENKYEKVHILYEINKKVNEIINNLKQSDYYKNKHIRHLCNTYNPKSLYENIDPEYTSYSLNKGQEIRLCLIDPNNKSVITDVNTILFVVIHELSHIMTPEVGHPPNFWKNMSFLLKFSIDNNIYKYVNYEKYPVLYCGVNVNKTPYVI